LIGPAMEVMALDLNGKERTMRVRRESHLDTMVKEHTLRGANI